MEDQTSNGTGEAIARQIEIQGHAALPPPAMTTREVAELVRSMGWRVDVKTAGKLLVLRGQGRVIDYWPTNQKWRERDLQMSTHRKAWHRAALSKGEGIQALLAEMRRQEQDHT